MIWLCKTDTEHDILLTTITLIRDIFIPLPHPNLNENICCGRAFQGTKIFQYCTCPACPANTCTCPIKVYTIKNIRESYVIRLP